MADDQNVHSIVRSLLGLSSSQQPMETNALIRELARRIVLSGFSFDETTGTVLNFDADTIDGADWLTLASALLWTSDNTHDIGATGATRPRDLHLGRNALIGGTLGVTGAATLSSTLGVTGLITGRDVTVISSTTTGATNNWAPAGLVSGTNLIRATGAALAATGLDGGSAGMVAIIRNTGSGVLTFAHNSGSSDADNRFQNLVTSAATPVAAGGYIIYIHNGTDWTCVAHEQGVGITPTFAAGDFTALTAGTWTVASGDAATMRYSLSAKNLTVWFVLNTTTVAQSGGNPVVLQISNGQWGGFTASASVAQAITPVTLIDNGTWGNGYAEVQGGANVIRLIKNQQAQWANATDATYIWGTITFEVT